ncbi:MAG: hypothetical protein V4584_14250 [Verrucomicrobiota bacterium]
MASEKSFQDRIQHTNDLSAAVPLLTPVYTPVDSKFTLAKLTTATTAAEAANANVEAKRIPYQDPTSDRVALVKTIGPLVTQALAYVKSNTAWENRHEAVKNAADKVRGVRPPKPKPVDPDPDQKTRETGERSYVEIAGHFKTFINRLDGLAGYAPQDEKISIDLLNDLHAELDSYNKSIPTASQALADAIIDRQDLFTGPTGLKFVFDGVKASVKGQYGHTSLQYKAVSGISW